MKGIILAGGSGTRLYPITRAVCKQLLPVYDKPMVYYPLSTLLLTGKIRDVLIITTPLALPRFKDLLGDGSTLGIKISYAAQQKPRGIAESLIIGERFIGKSNVSLILGDNIFYADSLHKRLKACSDAGNFPLVFAYQVKDPQRYGVVNFDKHLNVTSITEKPKRAGSKWAVTGLYIYDNQAPKLAKRLKPSPRGELEITDLNNAYLKQGNLKVELLSRGCAWLDTGTYDSLIDASMFIRTIEERQGLKIGCVEEVAYRMGYINKKQLGRLADKINTSYGEYLRRII